MDDVAHWARCSTTSADSANNSGSVIGVLCRYSTFGLNAKSVAARIAPVREPVTARTMAEMHATVIANEAIEIAIADAPVRYSQSICTGSALSRCGNGSHTAPICSQLGRQAVEDPPRHHEVRPRVVVAQRQACTPIHSRGDGAQNGSEAAEDTRKGIEAGHRLSYNALITPSIDDSRAFDRHPGP